jgi:hypothetical protein
MKRNQPGVLAKDQLAVVTGGLLRWETPPPMSSVGTGFGRWEKDHGLAK